MAITNRELELPKVNIKSIKSLGIKFPKSHEVLAKQAVQLLSDLEELTEQYAQMFRFYSYDSKVEMQKRQSVIWGTILTNSITDKARLGSEDKRRQMLEQVKYSDPEYLKLKQMNTDAACQLKLLEQAIARYKFLLYMTQQTARSESVTDLVEVDDMQLETESELDWITEFGV